MALRVMGFPTRFLALPSLEGDMMLPGWLTGRSGAMWASRTVGGQMTQSNELTKARAMLAELRELYLNLPLEDRLAVKRAMREAAEREREP